MLLGVVIASRGSNQPIGSGSTPPATAVPAPPAHTTGAKALPAPLEHALERLESEVRP
jgi:hypothetical protein